MQIKSQTAQIKVSTATRNFHEHSIILNLHRLTVNKGQ